MRFLVMGAGSIGSVVGGFLHLDGHQVYLLGKGPHIEAVMDDGLRISGIWGGALRAGHRCGNRCGRDALGRFRA